MTKPDFLPTAPLATLQWRAEVLRSIRGFFHDHGFWEVETPLLSNDGPVDPHLHAFTIPVGPGTYYLQTSPEFGLKRLVVAGADAIFQLGKSFRRDERSRLHNPEFTMLEWYRRGESYREQMEFVEALVRHCATFASGTMALPPGRFPCRTYQEAFQQFAGFDPMTADGETMKSAATAANLAYPELSLADRDGWLNVLLSELVEPNLGKEHPEFLCDYPPTQSALSKIRKNAVPVAERFELYIDGIELCNGYTELTDPEEMRDRIARESNRREDSGEIPLAESNRLLLAMEHGLPPCSGVAFGIDRFLMVLGGHQSIDEVIPFPWERA